MQALFFFKLFEGRINIQIEYETNIKIHRERYWMDKHKGQRLLILLKDDNVKIALLPKIIFEHG